MTRKDYELIARVLRNFVGDGGDVTDRDKLALELSKELPSPEVVGWTKFTNDFLYATHLALDKRRRH